MAIAKNLPDYAFEFNSLYKITIDTSGWDKSAIQLVTLAGSVLIYGSLDSGSNLSTQGNASLATNFVPIQATDLSTGTAVSTLANNKVYTVTDNCQFLRLQGVPAAAGTSIYKLLVFHQKID
jgi:hypothetical protein